MDRTRSDTPARTPALLRHLDILHLDRRLQLPGSLDYSRTAGQLVQLRIRNQDPPLVTSAHDTTDGLRLCPGRWAAWNSGMAVPLHLGQKRLCPLRPVVLALGPAVLPRRAGHFPGNPAQEPVHATGGPGEGHLVLLEDPGSERVGSDHLLADGRPVLQRGSGVEAERGPRLRRLSLRLARPGRPLRHTGLSDGCIHRLGVHLASSHALHRHVLVPGTGGPTDDAGEGRCLHIRRRSDDPVVLLHAGQSNNGGEMWSRPSLKVSVLFTCRGGNS